MSLADLSAQIRAALKWLLIIPVVLFILWFIWLGAKAVSKEIFKPRGEDTAFGTLAPLLFTKTFSPLAVDQFELATSLPKQKDKIAVFQVESAEKFSEKHQKEIVSFFKLSSAERKQEDNVTTWKSGSTTLSLDTTQGHFNYRLDFSKDATSLTPTAVVDKNQALKTAKEILRKLNLLAKDIDGDNPLVRFFTLSADKQEETSASSANAVEINFFRKVAGLRSSGDPLIRLLLEGRSSKILEFNYNYYPLNSTGSAYPIIGSDKAWEDLQAGKAFTEQSQEFDSVQVTKINLSYWESGFSQPYLQPVWVFLVKGKTEAGEKEFEAYLPAINPSFFWQEEESPT